MVINDGSTDGTLAALKEAFELVEVERVPRANLPSAPVRGGLRQPARRPPAGDRQGERRQGRLAQLRHPLRRLPAVLRDRLRHAARRRRAGAARVVLPGRARDGRHRRHRADRQRLAARGRPAAQAVRTPENTARQRPDRRVPARLPGRPRRLVAAEHAADRLRRVRAVPARDGRRGGRLRHQHGRRGRGARSCACTGTAATQTRRTRSPSSPTRSAGPRRRRTAAPCAASATAGSAACWRRCGATGG